MSRRDDNEMERIQRGLEAFLNQEMNEIESKDVSRRKNERASREETGSTENSYDDRELQMYTLEDWDSPRPRQGRGPASGNRRQSQQDAGGSRSRSEKRTQSQQDAGGGRNRSEKRTQSQQDAGGGRNRSGKRTQSQQDAGGGRNRSGKRTQSQQDAEGSRNRSEKRTQGQQDAGGGRNRSEKRTQSQQDAGGGRNRSGKRTQSQQDAGGGRSRSEKRTQSQQDAGGGRNRSGKRTQSQQDAGGSRSRSGKKKAQAKGGNAGGTTNTKGKSGKQKKPKSGFKRFLAALLIITVLLGLGLYNLVGVVYNKLNYHEIASVRELPMQEAGVVNVLLIGNDSRENGEDGRSDAMILLSISDKTKTIYMTSLLRDMYVEIPEHDNNRLNAAYSFGGAELLMETVEKNFDIPVNRYMQVNFEAFANLVDAVGGVELELTSQEVEYVNGYLVEYNMLLDRPQGTDNLDSSISGLIHLNGAQALAYCRNRYLGTDFGRTERQRKVLEAVIHKLPGAMLTNGGELIDGLFPNLTTNLTKNECFRLSLMAGKLLAYDIVPASIPLTGTYSNATIRKMAVLEVDFETNIKYLKENIYGE